MNESRLNIELFKKIRRRIASIPASYDQCEWMTESEVAPCGTAACLAGHAIICAAPDAQSGVAALRALLSSGDCWAVPNHAAALLGLRGEFRDWARSGDPDPCGNETAIFDSTPMAWPNRFRVLFYEGDMIGAAVAYLDHIISTGKVLE